MISSFDRESLEELLKNFYLAVGIRISIFDDSFNLVTEYPAEAPDICRNIRACEEGLRACHECDHAAFLRAKGMHKAHTYICHAGITEAIAPIQLDGGILGYAILAHLMPSENYEETVKEVCARCGKFSLTPDEVRTHLMKLKRYSRPEIYADMKLLEILAAYLQMSRMAQWKNDNISHRINEFIEHNLSSPLNSAVLCKHFFISRTKLYEICMQAFNMGISSYITCKRIERAKELLRDETLSVSEVGSMVGVDDYNYFCKLFRKKTGCAPGKYRKSLKTI